MSKAEFLEVLGKELERLETVEHVSDLANHGRCQEVDAIVSEIDYTALNDYMESNHKLGNLEISEIPEERYLAFAIYLSGSQYDECDVMECWADLQSVLRGCGEAGDAIADTMQSDCVNAFDTFDELLKGEYADYDDEEDEDTDEDDECNEEESDESGAE